MKKILKVLLLTMSCCLTLGIAACDVAGLVDSVMGGIKGGSDVESTAEEHNYAENGICTDCGVVADWHEHTFAYTDSLEKSCEDRTVEGLCECGEKNTTIVEGIGHDEVSHEGQAATCTEDGWKAYVTCSNCDYTTYEKIGALGHSEISHDGQAATCTEDGWKAYVTCSSCDYTTYETITKLGHKQVSYKAQAATCTEDGWKAYVACSRCDYTTYEKIDALGHDEVSHEGQAATCTEYGWEAYVDCSRCNYTTYKMIPAGHKWEDGKCSVCEVDYYTEGLYFDLSSDRTYYYVWALGGTDTEIVIPATYEDLPVKEIDADAFHQKDQITSVTIPDSVTYIGEDAFRGCTSLTTVTFIGNSTVTSIEPYTFNGCYALTSINLPDSITSIKEGAFHNCVSLESLKLPNSLESIDSLAFYDCGKLTELNLPAAFKTFGDNPFAYCYKLANINVAEDNATYKSIDGNLYSKDGTKLLKYAPGKTETSFRTPDGVTTIAKSAFNDVDAIEDIVLGYTVTTIEVGAFADCSNLKSIDIPAAVTSIGNRAFYSCSSLESVTFGENSQLKTIGEAAFRSTNLKMFIVPDMVTYIGKQAFYNCNSLTSLTLGDSVEYIGDEAFMNCPLETLIIPASVTQIGKGALEVSYMTLTSIEFVDSTGWYKTKNVSDWNSKTGGTEVDVTDAAANAETFVSFTNRTYYYYKA